MRMGRLKSRNPLLKELTNDRVWKDLEDDSLITTCRDKKGKPMMVHVVATGFRLLHEKAPGISLQLGRT